MGSDEAGRLLIYTYVEGQILFDPFPGEDLIELSASLQRRFPDQVVEPADPKWLRKATRESLPLPPSEEELAALLDALAQGQPIYAPGVAGSLLRTFTSTSTWCSAGWAARWQNQRPSR
jgi:hypothetical protein